MNPSEPPDLNYALGELTGKVDQIGERIGQMEHGFAALRESNAAEHAAVMERIGKSEQAVREGLDAKAAKTDVAALEQRTDLLEKAEDQRSGVLSLVRFAPVAGVFVIATLAYLAGSGTA